MSQAFADFGASIYLMPYSLYEKLELGELTLTRMSLSLEDLLAKYPRGIVVNFLVKVDKFVFPVDFVVLDMEADERVPISLGLPCWRTANALIDVYDGRITIRVGFDTCLDYICGSNLVGMEVDEELEEEDVDDVS
ncbi:uncharacterized protein LOC143566260 [Bidens hawaiensis]|uniref:uncharacterized protein LOC143566260 n=1 Tax=Bidens hawaiensis TaxID=980011 RepID=UPI00404AA250